MKKGHYLANMLSSGCKISAYEISKANLGSGFQEFCTTPTKCILENGSTHAHITFTLSDSLFGRTPKKVLNVGGIKPPNKANHFDFNQSKPL